MRLLPDNSIATPEEDGSATVRAKRQQLKKDMLDAVSRSPTDTPVRRAVTRRSVRAASVASSRASSVALNEGGALPSMMEPEEHIPDIATPKIGFTKDRSVSVSAPERRASVAPASPLSAAEQSLASPVAKAQVYLPPNVWSSLSLTAIVLSVLFLLTGAGLTLNTIWGRHGNLTVFEIAGYDNRLSQVEKQIEKFRTDYIPESIASVEKIIENVRSSIPEAISALEAKFNSLMSVSDQLKSRVQTLETKEPALTKDEVVALIENALHPISKTITVLSNAHAGGAHAWDSLPNFATRSAGAQLFRGKPFTSLLASSKNILNLLTHGFVENKEAEKESAQAAAAAAEAATSPESLTDGLVDLFFGWYPDSPLSDRMNSLCPNPEPSECKCLLGNSANISIKVGGPVIPTGFTLDRFPDSLLYTPQAKLAAPKEFEIYGLFGEDGSASAFAEPLFKGQFAIEGQESQHFKIENSPVGYSVFQLRILHNQGHQDATCIHRFRIHGRLA